MGRKHRLCPVKTHRKRFNSTTVTQTRRKSLSLRVSIPRSLYEAKKSTVSIVYEKSKRNEGNKKGTNIIKLCKQ